MLVLASPDGDRAWIPADGSAVGGKIIFVSEIMPAELEFASDEDWNVVAFDTSAGVGATPAEVLDVLRVTAPDATLLALSSSTEIREAVAYLKGGVYEYLALPVDAREFTVALEEAIDNNDAYREISQLNRMLVEEKEELASKNRELLAISTVARAVSHSLELDEVLDRLVSCVEETFSFDRISVGLVEAGERRERAKICRGADPTAACAEIWEVSPLARDPWVAEVYAKGLALRVDDPATDPRVRGTELAKIHPGPLAKVPMVARGTVVGTITVDNHRSGLPIGEEEVSVLKVFADTAAVAVENSRLYLMVKELSLRDELTGLYNRRYLFERAEAEMKNAERRLLEVTLIMLDLDFFKKLNDLNDHLTGDAALRKVSKAITGLIRGLDVAARFGGEEMVVLLPSTGPEDGAKVAEKLRAAIEELPVEGEKVLPGGRLTVSIGVASYPRNGDTLNEVLESADRALYRAKNAGRNRVEIA